MPTEARRCQRCRFPGIHHPVAPVVVGTLADGREVIEQLCAVCAGNMRRRYEKGGPNLNLRRPALRYHGGKWRLAPWIISHFPAHRVYVEPFGGAASVLLRKPRSYAEVYNDLDGEIVNLFRVLRNPSQARELVRLVKLTPFARTEFEESYITAGDPVEQARRTLIRSFMGFGSAMAQSHATGFRDNATRSGTTPAHDWQGMPDALEMIVERLAGVVVDMRPAAEVISRYDSSETLYYIDPPYVASTRNPRYAKSAYAHEMTDGEHRALAEQLHGVDGAVVVSGYRCDLYDEIYADWRREDKATFADGAQARTESLWLSPSARYKQASFFEI